MSEDMKHDEIIAETREKYTVHHCGQCEFRKSCHNEFDSDECKDTRQSIMLGFGIEDGYFTKLLDRLEAAHRREVDGYKGRIKLWSDRADELRRKCDEQYAELKRRCDGEKLLEALKRIVSVCADAEITDCQAREIIEDVAGAAIAEPPRNCDKFSKSEVLEILNDRSFSKEDTIEWLYTEADGSHLF